MCVLQDLFINGELDQAIAIEIHRHFLAGYQVYLAGGREDGALVPDGTAHQSHCAADGRLDETLVYDHAPFRTIPVKEGMFTGHEVFILDINAGGHQSADVDPGRFVEEHPVRVDE